MTASQDRIHDLTSLFGVIEDKIDDDGAQGKDGEITIREIMDVIGRRTYGPLLLLLGLISISPAALIPGSTWALALLTLVIGAQLFFLRRTPWMPGAILRVKVSEAKLQAFLRRARPVAGALDRVIRPRMQFMADPPMVMVVALMCILAALITFPLGFIPLAPFLPGLSVTLFGLGMTARDGILLSLAVLVVGGSGWVVYDQMA